MGALCCSLPRLGLGTIQQEEQLASIGVSTAGSVGTSLAVSGGLLTAGSIAVPLIGAALAGVSLLVTSLIANSGCGQTCIETSNWANQAESVMKQNLAAWQAEPHTVTNQQAALGNFDALWGKLVQLCSDPSTGNAGVRCIADREGSRNGGNGKYDWFAYYRDPIANATDVVADPTATSGVSSAVSGVVSGLQSSGLLIPILIGAAALLLGSD